MMGRAIAFDLANSIGKSSVSVVDANRKACKSAGEWLGVDSHCLEARDRKVDALMADSDAVIAAMHYCLNLDFTKRAIAAGAHFFDLGGNDDVVSKQLALGPKARKSGVLCLPDCGLAPGMAGILGAHLASRLDSVDELTMRVGGLPRHPVPPLNYQLVFSVGGLINEYKEKCKVLRNGRIALVDPMDELEELEFEGIGKLEAFTTSGGAAWLPEMFEGRVTKLDYKTIRYPGHAAIIRSILKLGLADEDEIAPGLTPRSVLERQMAKNLAGDGEDLVLVRVTARGKSKGRMKTLGLDIVDRYDRKNRISAMARTTSYPTSIIAQMVTDDRIPERGVMTPEMCVPGGELIREMAARKISVTES
jgi:lysine 6-dehydrogenase